MAKKKFKINMKAIDGTALTLLIIGGINWGASGLGFNIVEMIANLVPILPWLAGLVYTLVFASAIWVGIRVLMGKIKLVK